jgi:hypothetical protein
MKGRIHHRGAEAAETKKHEKKERERERKKEFEVG